MILWLKYFISFRRLKNVGPDVKKGTFRKILKLNLHPVIQFGKHLFIEFEKKIDYEKIKYELNKSKKKTC